MEQHLLQSPTKLHTLSGLRLEQTNFTRPKPLLLLAYLCLEGKQEKRFLAELFWPGASNHMNSLAKALSQLRQVGVVDNDDTHAWATVTSDVSEFLEAFEHHDLEKAATLYQDSFLSGFYLPDWGVELEEWVYSTREFLDARLREALLELAETSEDNKEATRYAERAYELKATLEPDLIPRLYEFLASTPHAAKLKQEAKEFDISLEQTKTISSNLPSRGTSFIGRDIERLELAELLAQADARLVTIVGQGGVGKTRLALELAREVKGSFPDGVIYIPLEALSTSEQMFSSLAATFSVQLTKDDSVAEIAKAIGEKKLLLLLDNAEHLLEQMREVSLLLHECSNLKLLVTSRSRLNLEEEWLYALEGFVVPDEVSPETAELSDAVALFVQRAKKVKPGFSLSGESLPFVLKICKRVEGLPLGIELAASWVKTLSCQEVADNLENPDFLTTSLSNVPERQHSLRSVFEGSWRLLSNEEQIVLCKLSVFRGGFSSEAAREVAGSSLMMLARLVNKSLLRVVDKRYQQHPLMQQYTREQLVSRGEEGELCKHHAHYYLSLAERAKPHLASSQQIAWFERLASEVSNLRSAFSWLLASSETALYALRLLNALAKFWSSSGYIREGRHWAQEALAQSSLNPSPERATLLHQAGTLAWLQGDYGEARHYLQAALEAWQLLGEKGGKARTLGNLANLANEEGNYEAAQTHYEAALELFRELADTLGIANTLLNSGILQMEQGYFDSATSRYQEALVLFRQLGESHGLASTLNSLGAIAIDQKNYSLASLYSSESLELHRATGYKVGQAIAFNILGEAALSQGELPKAREYFRESVRLQLETADKPGLTGSLEGFASLALAEGEADKAVRLWATATAARKAMHMPVPPRSQACREQHLGRALTRLGESAFASSWTLGSALELEQAITLALEEKSKT